MTKCSICKLATAGTLNAALNEGRSARSVAAEFDVSPAALYRHISAGHDRLSDTAQAEPASDDPLVELVGALRVRALNGSDNASREYRLALAALADVKHASAPPKRDLVTDPEWVELRTKILNALLPFPDARQAVADAIA